MSDHQHADHQHPDHQHNDHPHTDHAGGRAAGSRQSGDGDWRRVLRERGYRLTPQRELILEAVETLGHATPDEVLGEVRKRSTALNVSTVYRTLEVLEGLGLVRHAHLSDRAPTYHTVRDREHFHVVCRKCQRVISVAPDVLDPVLATLRDRYDFEADVGHLTVFGQCASCAATAEVES